MPKPIFKKARKMQTEAKNSLSQRNMKKLQEFLQANNMSEVFVAFLDKKDKKVN